MSRIPDSISYTYIPLDQLIDHPTSGQLRPTEDTVLNGIQTAKVIQSIFDAYVSLTPKQQQVFALRALGEVSSVTDLPFYSPANHLYNEIATITGTTPPNVRQLFETAKYRMRNLLPELNTNSLA